MRDTIKSYDNSQMLTPKSDDRTNFTLVQMHDRMLKLSNENTRLGNLILEK